MAQPDPPADLPIKLDPCSNGEFLPPPATPLIRETSAAPVKEPTPPPAAWTGRGGGSSPRWARRP